MAEPAPFHDRDGQIVERRFAEAGESEGDGELAILRYCAVEREFAPTLR